MSPSPTIDTSDTSAVCNLLWKLPLQRQVPLIKKRCGLLEVLILIIKAMLSVIKSLSMAVSRILALRAWMNAIPCFPLPFLSARLIKIWRARLPITKPFCRFHLLRASRTTGILFHRQIGFAMKVVLSADLYSDSPMYAYQLMDPLRVVNFPKVIMADTHPTLTVFPVRKMEKPMPTM